MLKDKIIDCSMASISKQLNYDKAKLSQIRYGLETLYLSITKTFVIFTLAFFLNILHELFYLMLFYSLLRLFGYGLHAKKSWQCWIGSILTFLLVPFLIIYLDVNIYILVTISVFCSFLLLKYAPADTQKRPLVNRKKARVYKWICFIISLIYVGLMIFINNQTLNNILLFSIVIETLMVLPISYKLFKLTYENYKSYKFNNLDIEEKEVQV